MKFLLISVMLILYSCGNETKKVLKKESENFTFFNQLKRLEFFSSLNKLGVKSRDNDLSFYIIRDEKKIIELEELLRSSYHLLNEKEREIYEIDFLPYYDLVLSAVRNRNKHECSEFIDFDLMIMKQDIHSLYEFKEKLLFSLKCLIYSKRFNQYKLYFEGIKKHQDFLENLKTLIKDLINKQKHELFELIDESYSREVQEINWEVNQSNYDKTITFEDYYWVVKKFVQKWDIQLSVRDFKIQNSLINGHSLICAPGLVEINMGPIANRANYFNALIYAARNCFVNHHYGLIRYHNSN